MVGRHVQPLSAHAGCRDPLVLGGSHYHSLVVPETRTAFPNGRGHSSERRARQDLVGLGKFLLSPHDTEMMDEPHCPRESQDGLGAKHFRLFRLGFAGLSSRL